MRTTESQATFADLELRRRGVHMDPLLKRISELFEGTRAFMERVHQDLVRGLARPKTGRRGLTAPQTVRSRGGWEEKMASRTSSARLLAVAPPPHPQILHERPSPKVVRPSVPSHTSLGRRTRPTS